MDTAVFESYTVRKWVLPAIEAIPVFKDKIVLKNLYPLIHSPKRPLAPTIGGPFIPAISRFVTQLKVIPESRAAASFVLKSFRFAVSAVIDFIIRNTGRRVVIRDLSAVSVEPCLFSEMLLLHTTCGKPPDIVNIRTLVSLIVRFINI